MPKNVGIFSLMSFSEYLGVDAMNCSTLKKVAQSPLHAQHELTTPSEPSQAFVIGDAFHGLVLEPERFDAEYALGLDCGKRTKADKEAWAEWLAEHPLQTALKHEEWDAVHAMREAVLAHPTAAEIMDGEGQNELTMVWEDPATGTLCKGRADRLTTLDGLDNGVVDYQVQHPLVYLPAVLCHVNGLPSFRQNDVALAIYVVQQVQLQKGIGFGPSIFHLPGQGLDDPVQFGHAGCA